MRDVAADAGVSLKTVSRVVNGVASVDPDLTERVRTSIASLGYKRNDVAASLRSGRPSNTIGLITADLSNSFYSRLSEVISTVAREHGSQVIMASSQESAEQERVIALDLCERRVAGLIIVPTISDHGYLRDEIDRGIPVVFLDRPGKGIEADAVVIDNRGGGRAAIGTLLASGHRTIAVLVDSLRIYTMQQRLLGVRDGLAEAGLSLPPEYVVEGIHSPDDALAAVQALLRLPEPPTAILCGNNRSTIGAVEALGRAGRDVEGVGFDDFELARLLPRPVTIVDYDVDGMGRLAATRLFSRIEGDTSVIRQELLPTRLRARGGWPQAG